MTSRTKLVASIGKAPIASRATCTLGASTYSSRDYIRLLILWYTIWFLQGQLHHVRQLLLLFEVQGHLPNEVVK